MPPVLLKESVFWLTSWGASGRASSAYSKVGSRPVSHWYHVLFWVRYQVVFVGKSEAGGKRIFACSSNGWSGWSVRYHPVMSTVVLVGLVIAMYSFLMRGWAL